MQLLFVLLLTLLTHILEPIKSGLLSETAIAIFYAGSYVTQISIYKPQIHKPVTLPPSNIVQLVKYTQTLSLQDKVDRKKKPKKLSSPRDTRLRAYRRKNCDAKAATQNFTF